MLYPPEGLDTGGGLYDELKSFGKAVLMESRCKAEDIDMSRCLLQTIHHSLS